MTRGAAAASSAAEAWQASDGCWLDRTVKEGLLWMNRKL